jgi:hypothetical protein
MWWVDWDEWLNDLFSNIGSQSLQSSESQVAAGRKAVGAANKVAESYSKAEEPYRKAANVQEDKAASSAPAPPSAPTPTPSPVTGAGTLDPVKMGEAAAAKYLQLQNGRNAGRGSKYEITEDSPMFLPKKGVKTGSHPSQNPSIIPVGQALNDIYSWDDKTTLAFSELAIKAGYRMKPTYNKAAVFEAWKDMVNISAGTLASGKRVSPWQLIRRYAAVGEDVTAESLAKPKTVTQTTYSVTDARTAEQLAHAALSERLGRSATPEEVREFSAELTAAQRKEPMVTTTTVDGKGNTTSTTQEGLTSATAINAYATDWALGHNKDEAAAYQQAGIMMPWFFEALSAPV